MWILKHQSHLYWVICVNPFPDFDDNSAILTHLVTVRRRLARWQRRHWRYGVVTPPSLHWELTTQTRRYISLSPVKSNCSNLFTSDITSRWDIQKQSKLAALSALADCHCSQAVTAAGAAGSETTLALGAELCASDGVTCVICLRNCLLRSDTLPLPSTLTLCSDGQWSWSSMWLRNKPIPYKSLL